MRAQYFQSATLFEEKALIFGFMLCLGWLVALETLAENFPAPATKPERKVLLVLGDSLAAGYGVEPAQAFPALLQQKVDATALPFQVVNAGVSGDTSAGGLRRLDWLLKRPVDVLLLELGGNDGLRGLPPAATRTNLQAIIDRTKARNPRAEIVIAGMQMPPNMGPDYAAQFREIFPSLARTNQTAIIPFLLEGVGGKPEFNLPDRIHPTAVGHEIIAENIWKTLHPVLTKTAADQKPAPANTQ